MLDAENNPETPMLIRAVISHFMFESVHPFYDGNGRMGRLLLGIHLSNLLSAPTALRLSRLVAEEKARYYKAFSETEHPLNRGDATHFVATMLELVSETQSELHGDLSQRIEALEHLKSRAPKHGDAAPGCGEGALRALYLLAQVDLFGSPNGIRLDEVAAYVEKNVRTARKYLQELQDHGLATTTSERPLRWRRKTGSSTPRAAGHLPGSQPRYGYSHDKCAHGRRIPGLARRSVPPRIHL